MLTLVLVVGSENLYDKVSQAISKKFQTNELRQNPPIVKHISRNTATQLGKYEITQWIKNDAQNNKKVAEHLENQTSFIFYCDGSVCNVYEANNANNAVAEICDLPKLLESLHNSYAYYK